MKQESQAKSPHYYGKKTYRLNPLIVRKKPIEGQKPDYSDEVTENTDYYPNRFK